MKINRAFVFPGQGAQIVGMSKDIYQNFAAARAVFEEVSDSLQYDLKKIIFEGPFELLSQTIHTQPALMCVSMAITRVVEELAGDKIYQFGSFFAGHSLGEYSALCAMGSLTLTDTTKLLDIRGRAMQQAAPLGYGAMAAVIDMPIMQLQTVLKSVAMDEVCQVANDNSAQQIVISGTTSAIERAIKTIKDFGFKAIKLNVSAPFHSVLMSTAATAVEVVLKDIILKSPNGRFIANISANELKDTSAIKQALVDQLTGTVRWRETIEYLTKNNVTDIVEIGAGQILTNLLKKSAVRVNSYNISNIQQIENFLKTI